MKYLLIISTFIFSLTLSANETLKNNLKSKINNCSTNCSEIVTTGEKHYVLALDALGDVFKVIPVELPKNIESARSATSKNSSIQTMSGNSTSSAVRADTSTTTYWTHDEIIVVLTVLVFDERDNLYGVSATVSRIKK
jgi:hypothetical protein